MTSASGESTTRTNVINSAPLNHFPSRSREHGLSVFHCELPSGAYIQADECLMAVQQCVKALNGWCEAGTRAVTTFLKMLKGTVYEQIAGQLRVAMMQVQELAEMEMLKLQRNLQTSWCHLSRFSDATNLQTDPAKDGQIVVKEMINFVGCFCQLFLFMSQHLSGLNNSSRNDTVSCRSSVSEALAPLSFDQKPVLNPVGSRPVVPNNSRSKAMGGSSPAGLRKQVTSFLSKIGHKSPDTSCFYVPLDGEGGTSSSVTSNVHPPPPPQQNNRNCNLVNVDGRSNGHVATQEDLDLVIGMLSQRTRIPAAGMQAIPEHHPLVAGQADGAIQMAASHSKPGPGLGFGVQALGSMQPIGSELSKDQPCNQSVSLTDRRAQNEKTETSDNGADALAKMSTWPFKMNQKPFWPSWGDWRMMQNVLGMTNYSLAKDDAAAAGQPHHPGTWPVKDTYDQRMATLMPGGWYGGLWPTMSEAASDANGVWPSQYSTWNTDCMSSVSKSVSTAVESSSGSEESNCGDQHWMAGGQEPRRSRRHSSGDHSLLSQHITLSNPLPGIDGSLRGHAVEKKLSWTDQLQAIDRMTAADGQVLSTGHQALSMHWSDPLTNRPLSYWDGDLLSVTKSQSSNASSGSRSKPSALPGGRLDKLF